MNLLEKYLAPGEDWEALCDRVSGIMPYETEREQTYHYLRNKLFLPNSPTLVNAGRAGGRNMMACHLLEVPNSIEGIMDTAKAAAIVFKSGGGLGLEFSGLSPDGTPLKYAPTGIASGPVSFLRIFDAVAQTVMEGGLRRAAMMATLNTNHLDIVDFISCKDRDGILRNFNISVTADDFNDIPPTVFDKIVEHAHWNGEPGLVFLDNVNLSNPVKDKYGWIRGVNACSEIPLYHGGSCVLASINLPKCYNDGNNWLPEVTTSIVRFLNRIIDINNYPLPEIAQQTRLLRRIGIGVMGFQTLLDQFGIPWDHEEARELAGILGTEIKLAAMKESRRLAERDGGFMPGHLRNVALTAIAPTGHISRLAGVSASIYPHYADGLGYSVKDQLDMIAAWQVNVDSAISYTISIPNDAPSQVVYDIFVGAYNRGIKAISVYRDGSREGQPCKAEGTCSL